MIKYSVYIVISNDGFIAKNNGDTLWLNDLEIKGDAGYEKFYKSVYLLIFGKNTYKQLLSYNLDQWPYKGKKCIILSNETFDDNNIESFDGSIDKLHQEIKDEFNYAWIMGDGYVVNDYLTNNLVHDFILTIADKVNLNSGIKLFTQKDHLKYFRLTKSINFGNVTNYYYKK